MTNERNNLAESKLIVEMLEKLEVPTLQSQSIVVLHVEAISKGYSWLGVVDRSDLSIGKDGKEKFDDIFARPQHLNVERYAAIPRLENIGSKGKSLLKLDENKLDVYGKVDL